jgi:hypothetical protein
MWIPNKGSEPFDEVCHLCRTFSGGHNKRPDPPAAELPCPGVWPSHPDMTDEEFVALEKILARGDI